MIKIKKLNQAGDTLIEVMIAMVVLSMVLGGAYVTANRSSNTVRAAQEKGEALKFVEGQVEQLRFIDPDSTDPVFDSEFCFDASGDPVAAPCRFGPDDRYNLFINDEGSYYMAWAVWDRINSGTEERIEMVYRIVNQ